MKGQHQAAPRGRVLHQGPLTVLVLKATEPFEYESPEEGRNRMFHATVATCNQFFHVKVLNSNLKEKFTKENIITVLDYYECKGILEINKTSSVYEADPFQVIEVPNSIMKRANETPKIDNLYKQASGTFVYGLFLLHEVILRNCFYFLHPSRLCALTQGWNPAPSPVSSPQIGGQACHKAGTGTGDPLVFQGDSFMQVL